MNQPQSKKMEIKIKDDIPGGAYANAMQVMNNKEEFHLIFMHLLPPSGKVAAKVTTSPGHLKRIIKALQENVQKYEKQFGQITEAQAPLNEIGFKDQN